jgi:hypothetical protein
MTSDAKEILEICRAFSVLRKQWTNTEEYGRVATHFRTAKALFEDLEVLARIERDPARATIVTRALDECPDLEWADTALQGAISLSSQPETKRAFAYLTARPFIPGHSHRKANSYREFIELFIARTRT